MFRIQTIIQQLSICFPRVRGDVPTKSHWLHVIPVFSPRARGCSARIPHVDFDEDVFPACAGMFRRLHSHHQPGNRFPRVRGDVPLFFAPIDAKKTFSPRARGCSGPKAVGYRWKTVFPACAGMFRSNNAVHVSATRFPRVRGDVPRKHWGVLKMPMFSPRARGCSLGAFFRQCC